MALAEAQERRAAARYDQLAARMDRFGSPETATLFRQLATMEREHVEALSDWASPAAPRGRHCRMVWARERPRTAMTLPRR